MTVRFPVFFFLLLALGALACTLGAPPAAGTPVPAPSRPPAGLMTEPLGGAAVAVDRPVSDPNAFAPLAVTPVAVEGALGWLGLPALDDLANPADLWPLDAAQRAALEENGFVVVPVPYPDVAAVHAPIVADGRPLFLSADAVLHASVSLQARIWHESVLPQLAADVTALVQTMARTTTAQWVALEAGTTPAERSLAEAARRNLAYLGVAARLLDAGAQAPPAVAQLVADEWTLVTRADGEFASPISGVRTDYRQFAGPPAVADALRPAFRALQWLQAMPLPLSGSPGEMRRRVQRELLLLAAVTESANQPRLQRIDATLTYFWGPAHPFAFTEAAFLAEAVFGGPPDLIGLTDPAALDSFIRTADAAGVREWRFFHAGDVPRNGDAALLETLTFNRVGVYLAPAPEPLPLTATATDIGLIRTVARPLDLAAAYGSDRAAALLQASGDAAYESYDTQMAAARAQLGALDAVSGEVTWHEAWHHALQPLLQPPLAAGPAFSRGPAWVDSRLYAWQAAWGLGELLPSSGTGDAVAAAVAAAIAAAADEDAATRSTSTVSRPPEAAVGDVYLEPAPVLYARMAALLRQMEDGLGRRALLSPADNEALKRMAAILDDLSEIAAAERESTFWRPANVTRLREIVGELGAFGGLPLPQVADVYRAANDGRTVQLVVSGFYPVFVIAPWDTRQRVFSGAVWASAETVRAEGDLWSRARLLALGTTEAVDRPVWTDSFISSPDR